MCNCSSGVLELSCHISPPPPVQVLVLEDLHQASTATQALPPAPADDPQHVDQLVAAQLHLSWGPI